MYREYLKELAADLRMYSEIQREAGNVLGADLTERAARELERETGRPMARAAGR